MDGGRQRAQRPSRPSCHEKRCAWAPLGRHALAPQGAAASPRWLFTSCALDDLASRPAACDLRTATLPAATRPRGSRARGRRLRWWRCASWCAPFSSDPSCAESRSLATRVSFSRATLRVSPLVTQTPSHGVAIARRSARRGRAAAPGDRASADVRARARSSSIATTPPSRSTSSSAVASPRARSRRSATASSSR